MVPTTPMGTGGRSVALSPSCQPRMGHRSVSPWACREQFNLIGKLRARGTWSPWQDAVGTMSRWPMGHRCFCRLCNEYSLWFDLSFLFSKAR